jgi:uncharacterized protein (DUF697 family)
MVAMAEPPRDAPLRDESVGATPRREIADSLRRLETLLGMLPSDAARDLRGRIATLRTLMVEQRPPALALVGRRGSGKSSLVNALVGGKVAELGHVRGQTGKGRWVAVETPRGPLALLDTRGVQEGSRPKEDDDAATPLASILAELRRRAPDAVLFVVRAIDVDSAIDADLDALGAVLRAAARSHGTTPPVVAVITHADLLEPKATRLADPPPDGSDPDLDEKLAHVALAERTLEEKLRARPDIAPHAKHVMAVSTYLSFRPDGTIRGDERWRTSELSRALFDHLPTEGRAAFARLSQVRGLQDDIATDLTRATATLCAGIAAVPIPIADVLPLTTLQAGLVASIAWVSGRPLDTKAATEFLGALGLNVGAAFAFREAARALVKYVFPGAGAAVSAGVAFAGTMALGAAAKAYFVHGEPIEVARRIFRDRRSDAAKGDER